MNKLPKIKRVNKGTKKILIDAFTGLPIPNRKVIYEFFYKGKKYCSSTYPTEKLLNQTLYDKSEPDIECNS